MKKITMLIAVLCIAGFQPAFSQSLIFSNQTITAELSQLSIESVEFQPLEIVTNTVFQWLDPAPVVTTNGMMEGFTLETNMVSQQVSSEVVTTNAATWVCNVIFALPSGHQWELNRMPVTIQRFKTALAVPVNPATVQATFGPAAAGLEFAAGNGAFQPTGQVKDAFLSFAAAVLAGGVQ